MKPMPTRRRRRFCNYRDLRERLHHTDYSRIALMLLSAAIVTGMILWATS